MDQESELLREVRALREDVEVMAAYLARMNVPLKPTPEEAQANAETIQAASRWLKGRDLIDSSSSGSQ